MTLAEAELLADGRDQERRDRWEMIRRICHAVFQSQSRRPIEPEQVMEFSWDDEDDTDENEAMTGPALDKAREEAKQALDRRKNGRW